MLRAPLRITVAALLLCLAPRYFAGDPSADQWKGRRELVVFDFGPTTEEVPNSPPKIYESGLQTEFSYDVYQNNLGVVRYVLTHRSGARKDSVGDFASRLVDHRNNSTLVFSTPNTAYRGPLTPAQARATKLEDRRLLGFDCKGVEIRYEDRNHFKHLRQMWTPAQATFKDALLEIGYIYDPDGSLREITLGAITQLEKVPSLDPALFELAKGVKVINETR
jgi:hypothetical protein